jgi:DNA polymerase-3 subunit beta
METTFIVEQKPLMSLLASMQPICTKRTTLDATSTILFQVGHRELVLKSTDLEISLQASYQLKASTVTEPVSFLVSGRRIFDLVKELDGDIELTLENQQLKVKTGSVYVALNIKDPSEFPPFPERIENLMHLEAADLLGMFNSVAFLVPQNNANPGLNGLYIELSPQELKLTSTDGHCLAQVRSDKYTLEENKKWLLPRRAVFEVKKLLESCGSHPVFLGVCGNQLVFSGDTFNFFSKLLADPFPQYEAILNRQGFMPARVEKASLVKALRRSVCLLSGQFIATHFAFQPARLSMSMQNKEVGKVEEHLPLEEFVGDELAIRFYAPYLLTGLQAFDEERISFYLQNASKPIIFETQGKTHRFLYLVMPVAPTHGT